MKKKFKKGDIIVPLKTRKTSNNYSLKHIVACRVIKSDYSDWPGQKPRVKVVLLKGYVSETVNHYGLRAGDRAIFTVDAFELQQKPAIYEIW